MRIILILILIVSIYACSNSEESLYHVLNSFPTKNALFQTKYFEKDSLTIDTIRIGNKKNEFLSSYLDTDKGIKMFNLLKFDFQDSYQRISLNYDLIQDTILHTSTSFSEVGKIKSYKIEGKNFKVFKEPYWYLTKSKKPTYCYFYSEDFGLIFSLNKNSNSTLIGYENEEMSLTAKRLIDRLMADKEFCHLKE